MSPTPTLIVDSVLRLRDVLFDEMTDGVLIIDSHGVILDCNPAFHRRLGYEKNELIGVSVRTLDPPQFAAKVPERMAAILRDGQATFETAHYRKDGSIMAVELNSRVCSAGGETVFLSIVRDISARKELEDRLAARLEIHDATINTPALGFWLVDLQGRLLEVNDAYARQSGYSRDELLALRIPDLEAMEKPEETAAHIERLRKQGYDRFRSAHRRKDGSVWPVEIVTTFIKVRGDRLVVFIEDITEREQAEVALRRTREELEDRVRDRTKELSDEIAARRRTEADLRKLSRAVEHSAHMIFITDQAGTIEYVNPKFTEWLGYEPEEVIGRKPNLIKSGDTPDGVYDSLWRTILAGREWRGELKDRRKDGGAFWASVAIAPVRDEDDRISHFIAVHENITERKEAEEAMEEARTAAESANRAKSDLLANMSHELRTPLNAIIGFSEAMRGHLFGPLGNDKYEEYAAFIHSSGSHLLALINDILDVSAVEANKLRLREEEVDLTTICDIAVTTLTPKAESGAVTITGLGDPTLPRLWADPLRVKQIFLNLLSNGVKFTPEGGRVTCSATVDPATGEMVVAIADTGIGMDAAGIDKALTKFGQVDSSLSRRHEGTGLGLPLVQGLVELHGGSMTIDSAPGRGTTVTVRFPAARVIAR